MTKSRTRPRTAHTRLVCVLAFGVALAVVDVAGAAVIVRTWPTGPSPCDDINDLQSCLDSASAGDVIEIAANAIPSQGGLTFPSPGISLTVRPAAGFTPVFADFTSIFGGGSDDDVTIVIEGLTFVRGGISVRQGGEGTLDVTIRDNEVQQGFSSAISVSSGNTQPPYGPVLFRVENNRVSMDGVNADAISVGGFQGNGNIGSIVGNVIDLNDTGSSGGGIDVAIGAFTLDVDIFDNDIRGADFNSGITLFGFSDGGSLTARVVNNIVSGQFGNTGISGAIGARISGGTGDLEIVNNTLAFNRRGISVGARTDLGATATAVVANNIAVFSESYGIDVDPELFATVVVEYNQIFGNGSYPVLPGVENNYGDPLFEGPGDFRLADGSPAIDTGNNARVPGDVITDILGGSRIVNGTVNRGAIEGGGEPGIRDIPALGTLGLVLLALGLGWVAVSRMRF